MANDKIIMQGAKKGAGEKVEKTSAAKGKLRYEDGSKVGRNDPCPCGSEKKYKKCHGR